jgi:hypothetical protein
MLRRLRISLLIGTGATLVLLVSVYLSSGTSFARLALFAGEPVSWVLFRVLPSEIVYALVPEGGATATAVVFAVSALITWLLIFSMIAFAFLSRAMRRVPHRGSYA